MHVVTIGSSSAGNATLIYNDDTSILLDCGISVKTILEKIGNRIPNAVLISHEHGDHIKTAGAFGRKTKVPIYVNDVIVQDEVELFKNCTTLDITETTTVQIGSMSIKPFSTKHDARHSLGFVFTDKDTKFCYLTDTGSISKTIREAIKDCNSYFIECDYDEEIMSTFEDYSQELKDRITSNFGHLSTQQALELVKELDIDRIKVVIIGHLSQRTNSPEKVKQRIQEQFPQQIAKFHIAPFSGSLEV